MATTSGCPNLETLEGAAAGGEVASETMRHLENCDRCARELAVIKENNALLRELSEHGAALDDASDAGDGAEEPVSLSAPGYRTTGVIACGGQGVVFRGVHKRTGRAVAIKALSGGAWASERQRRRFEREMEIIARLRHPNIVALYETAMIDNVGTALVMEFVEGAPISEGGWCTEPPRDQRALRNRLGIFLKICEGVSHAHRHGVIHRDIKPGNVIIDSDGEPRILDFGVAKLTSGDSTVSVTGEFVGTLSCAAPEQVRRRGAYADTRSDVYALGALLFRFCSGTAPYDTNGSVEETISNIANETAPRPSSLNRAVNAELDAIILKALSKDPARRYQSADALATDLRRFLKGDPIEAKADSAWYVLRKTARRYRAPIGVAAVIAALVFVFGAVALRQRVEIAVQRDEALAAARRSNLERGRVLARDGNGLLAERLIWPAFLHDAGDVRAVASSDPPTSPAHWALWELYSHHPCLASARAGDSSIERLRCGADGAMAATCHEDGSVQLWSLPDLERLATLASDGHHALDVSISPDPPHTRTIGREGRIVTWRGAEVVGVRTLEVAPFIDAAFGPDGESVGVLLEEGGFAVLDARSGEAVARSERILHRPDRIWLGGEGALAVRCLVDADQPPNLRVFRRDGNRLVPDRGGGRMSFSACEVGPEGRILKGTGDGNIVLHGSSADHVDSTRNDFSPSLAGVAAFAISLERTMIASGGRGRLIRMWDLETKRRLADMAGHPGRIQAISFADQGDLVVSADSEGVIKVWEALPRLGVRRLEGHDATITQVRFDPTGERVFTTGYDGTVRIWSAADCELIETWKPAGHEEGINAANLDSAGDVVATSGHHRTRDVHIRCARSGAPQAVSERAHKSWVSWIAFSPDCESVLSASRDGVILHDVATGAHRATLFEGMTRPKRLCFSPDGSMLVCLSANGYIEAIGHPDHSRRIWSTQIEGRCRCMAISPNGTVLAVAGQRAVIHLLDAGTGEPIGALKGHERSIFDVAFHPSGRLLASGARDGSIKIWDVERQCELITLTDHERGVFALDFSPDGGALASGGEDNTLRIWDLDHYRGHIAGNRAHQRAMKTSAALRR